MKNFLKNFFNKEIDALKAENKNLLCANTRLQKELSALQTANYELDTNYKNMVEEYKKDHETYIAGIAEVNKLKEQYENLIATMKDQRKEYEKQMKVILGI